MNAQTCESDSPRTLWGKGGELGLASLAGFFSRVMTSAFMSRRLTEESVSRYLDSSFVHKPYCQKRSGKGESAGSSGISNFRGKPHGSL
jgi:hypothetical protein